MGNKIIYIKLKEGCKPIEYFRNSFDERKNYYYNLSSYAEDELEISKACIDSSYFLIALIHDNDKIIYSYLGTGTISHNDKGFSIKFSIKSKLNYGTAIKNICKLSELSLSDDFAKDEYVLKEESELIAKQIDFIINRPFEEKTKEQRYEKINSEDGLDDLAQRNEYCERAYNLRAPKQHRGEFQRDYERIVHSKAFRRMVDKAQVFSASKGDYYRTRMTHTQAVSQIARGIAEGLGLNMYLTEAIALGHDIGHTPFGHQGERTLDSILQGKFNIIKNVESFTEDLSFGGFKHNYQSIRVATLLEEEYTEICGMDLSYQTLEGMLKHTKLKRDNYSLDQFISSDDASDKLYFKQDFCSTLEGQVVAIADEIAQRGHDLDDAFSSGAMEFDDFKNYLTVKKMKELLGIVETVNKDLTSMCEKNRRFVDKKELRNSRTVSAIVSYFINDVINNSKSKMSEYDLSKFKGNYNRVKEELICFSEKASTLNKYLETIISSKVINSPEVSLFDNNAETIISGLFKAYYNNPRLLHKGTQRKLYINLRNISENVVDFEYGNHEVIKEEFDMITNENLKELSTEDAAEYKEKRRVLVRTICDFISGMTDTYAINEYNRIIK
ncbi:dGTP triphosphohydrolase [Ruminococcus bicirculans (ex Wegman et al. 2014)]|jgi:predicted deoxyguanosinetriphosphate triphosphohydrolase|uniref:deoxyguanosinetriphosphate triphosphohydrolase family protein n=1 Tax=Ruminococcus bicirculans (ex Wegman et al. 2014) TaxID=1160721 RepID=UPI00307C8957